MQETALRGNIFEQPHAFMLSSYFAPPPPPNYTLPERPHRSTLSLGLSSLCVGGNVLPVPCWREKGGGGVESQSKELTRGPPELVQHFRL